LSAARQQKINVQHQLLLTEQLVATDNEIKATLKVAEHQADVEKKVDAIKAEIETQDQHITQMQKHFKEAENILVSNILLTSLFLIISISIILFGFLGNSVISSKTKITIYQ
jgi:hypothetical protein